MKSPRALSEAGFLEVGGLWIDTAHSLGVEFPQHISKITLKAESGRFIASEAADERKILHPLVTLAKLNGFDSYSGRTPETAIKNGGLIAGIGGTALQDLCELFLLDANEPLRYLTTGVVGKIQTKLENALGGNPDVQARPFALINNANRVIWPRPIPPQTKKRGKSS